MSTSTQTFKKGPILMPISYKEHSTTAVVGKGLGLGKPGCVCVCVCVEAILCKLHLEAGNFFSPEKEWTQDPSCI